jgi:hypothetical protein
VNCPCYKKLLSYGLDDRGYRVRFLVGARNFSLYHHIQNGSGAHPASYPLGTRGSFTGGKAAGHEADHAPPSSAEVKECMELYLHSPNMPAWHDARLKKAQGHLYLYLTFYKKLLIFVTNFTVELNSGTLLDKMLAGS